MSLSIARAVMACSFLSLTHLAARADGSAPLETVVVTATRLREAALVDVPASATVLSRDTLTLSAQQHFEEVLSHVPNLNWAAGSSRPRYFQIRGIGSREQYEGAPNSEVGLLIDGIDFSGIGMAATLFDIDRVEVLRGPQGTILGANALAGIIALESASPEDEYSSSLSGDLGNYDTRSVGLIATGPAPALDSTWRISAQRYRSDGFRSNPFLRREDTNGRDEDTARVRWRWRPSERDRVDLTLLHVNLANGYDAFSIDNSRVTLSDDPGEDSQRANAGAVKWQHGLARDLELTLSATTLDSRSVHAYDGDWGNAQSWSPYTYDFVYRAVRERRTQSFEARVAAPKSQAVAWLVGAYALRLREDIDEISAGTLIDPDPVFGYVFAVDDYRVSHYDATNLALFAQLDGEVASRWQWSLGVRGERRDADYSDRGNWSGDPNRSTVASARDTMFGGSASLTYRLTELARAYATLSRGYRAGGFNFGLARQRQPEFKPEFLWNYEVGVKSSALDGRLFFDSAAFYMQRKSMQVRSGTQLTPGDPNSFVFFTGNAARGYNYGLESGVRLALSKSFELGATLGFLRTSVEGLLDANGDTLPKREQAHAPNYQAQVNLTWRRRGYMARAEVAANDAFYFDVDHNERSQAYEIVNFKVGYEAETWQLYGWVRNAFDRDYATRGFYFGNEPPNFDPKLYMQLGDPRQVGVSAKWGVR